MWVWSHKKMIRPIESYFSDRLSNTCRYKVVNYSYVIPGRSEIWFMSCSGNGNKIALGIAKWNFAILVTT